MTGKTYPKGQSQKKRAPLEKEIGLPQTSFGGKKTIQAALKESEEKYHNLFEQSNDAIFVHDLDGHIRDVNQKGLDLFGYTKPQILSLKISRLHPDYALSKSQLAFETISQTGSVNFDIDFLRKDGTIFPASVSSSLFEAGGRKLVQGLVRDITSQRKAEQIQSVLFNITQATSAAESLEELLQVIHHQLGTLIDTTNFYVALYDRESDLYSFPFVKDEFEENDTFSPQELKKSLTDCVRRTGKALRVDYDVHKKLTDEGEVDLVGTDSKLWMGAPLKTPEGIMGVVVVQSYSDDILYSEGDLELLSYISEHIAMAINRKRAEEKIKASLKEKDVLLKEIHHRVKNNMQIISSLIRLQSRDIEDEMVQRIFEISQNRIRSIALIHETLYQSEDLSQIDFSQYMHKLTTHLLSIYRPQATALNINLDVQEVLLDINQAIPCGLIINELVSNAMKHAFPLDKGGEIYLRCAESEGVFTLIVKDNGKGFPGDMDFRKADSLGLQIVSDLVQQLEGDIRLEQEEGTAFVITFRHSS